MPLGILAQVPHKGKGGGPALRQLASAPRATFSPPPACLSLSLFFFNSPNLSVQMKQQKVRL